MAMFVMWMFRTSKAVTDRAWNTVGVGEQMALRFMCTLSALQKGETRSTISARKGEGAFDCWMFIAVIAFGN